MILEYFSAKLLAMPEVGPKPGGEPISTPRTGGTPEGDSIGSELPWDWSSDVSGQIMDSKSICFLGKGACVEDCPLIEASRKVFSEIPPGVEIPQVAKQLRTMTVFGDVFDRRSNVIDVANTMDACIKEKPATLE